MICSVKGTPIWTRRPRNRVRKKLSISSVTSKGKSKAGGHGEAPRGTQPALAGLFRNLHSLSPRLPAPPEPVTGSRNDRAHAENTAPVHGPLLPGSPQEPMIKRSPHSPASSTMDHCVCTLTTVQWDQRLGLQPLLSLTTAPAPGPGGKWLKVDNEGIHRLHSSAPLHGLTAENTGYM